MAMVLIKHMFNLKLENMQLKTYNKEMQAILKQNDIEVPVYKNSMKVDPEQTPINPKEEAAGAKIIGAKEEVFEPHQVSQSIQSSCMSDDDDEEDETNPPAKDLPLL